MRRKAKFGLLLLFLASGIAPAAASDVVIRFSPIFLHPIGPVISGSDSNSYFDSSIGFAVSLGFIMDDRWELRSEVALLPFVLNIENQDSGDLLSMAKAGLGIRMPVFRHSTLTIGGDVGLYQVQYRGVHHEPSLCFDLEASLEKSVADWIALFGGLGYSSFLVDYTTEPLLNAFHFMAGVSFPLRRH